LQNLANFQDKWGNPPGEQYLYPQNTLSTTEFIDKLFLNSPLTMVGNLPDPVNNPQDPCVRTLVNVTTPDNAELSTLEDYPGVIWPGALYQGASVPGGVGSLLQIPVSVTKRNGLYMVSDTTYSQTYVASATAGNVYTAIGNIMAQGEINWENAPSKVYFKVVEASSLRELSVSLGLNASAFGATVAAKLDANTSSSANNVYVVFLQTLFNVFVDLQGNRPLPGLFNNNLTVPDLEDLGDHNELGYTNLPTYMQAVSYGRFLVARYSSTKASQELKASLEKKFKAGDIAAATTVEAHYKRIIDESSVEVLAYGGPYTIQKEALKTDGWKDYFDHTDIPLNTLKPISYIMHRWDGQPAKVQNVMKYYKRECPAVPAKIEVKVDNQKGNTFLYLKKAGTTSEIQVVAAYQDGAITTYDLTPYLTGGDDTIRIHSQIDKYGLFGTSRRNTTVSFIVDGSPVAAPNSPISGSCSTCHSADLAVLIINKSNGKVQKL
jgi:hypothetical protein